MYQDFRIGIGVKNKAFGLEFVAQLLVVLNNAVVNQSDSSIVRVVRVSIGRGWPPMRRPSGMGNRRTTLFPVVMQLGFQHRQFPRRLNDFDFLFTGNRNPSGVISPVLQPPQHIYNRSHSGLRPDISCYSAHD
jgi:hypothetical protein